MKKQGETLCTVCWKRERCTELCPPVESLAREPERHIDHHFVAIGQRTLRLAQEVHEYSSGLVEQYRDKSISHIKNVTIRATVGLLQLGFSKGEIAEAMRVDRRTVERRAEKAAGDKED